MSATMSDALVLFGATGDLAFKKIYPALHGLAKRGQFDIPLICVARSGWDVNRMCARIRASMENHGSFDEAAYTNYLACCVMMIAGVGGWHSPKPED